MTLPPDPEGMNDDRAQWADAAIIAALKDLRGDQPAVKSGECRWCGRNYDDVADGPCPADDCPTFKADAILAKIKEAAP